MMVWEGHCPVMVVVNVICGRNTGDSENMWEWGALGR